MGLSFKGLTQKTAKRSSDTAKLTRHWAARVTWQGHLPVGSEAATRTSTGYCANTYPRNGRWTQ